MNNTIKWTNKPLIKKFFSFVEKTNNCWIWNGSVFHNGYGQFHLNNKKIKIHIRAHRFSYILFKGKIPHNKCVCHSCDNPSCVNPDHLWIGTHKENAVDRVRKGRSGDGGSYKKKLLGLARGERNSAAKINLQIANNIRKERNNKKYSLKKLAKKFRLSASQISNIIHNRHWYYE